MYSFLDVPLPTSLTHLELLLTTTESEPLPSVDLSNLTNLVVLKLEIKQAHLSRPLDTISLPMSLRHLELRGTQKLVQVVDHHSRRGGKKKKGTPFCCQALTSRPLLSLTLLEDRKRIPFIHFSGFLSTNMLAVFLGSHQFKEVAQVTLMSPRLIRSNTHSKFQIELSCDNPSCKNYCRRWCFECYSAYCVECILQTYRHCRCP